MKTQSVKRFDGGTTLLDGMLAQARGLHQLTTWVLKTGLIVMPALGLMILSSWAVSDPVSEHYTKALLWACGIVFVTLTVESEELADAVMNLAIGLGMMGLVWMSADQAPQLAVIASALPTGWIGWMVLHQ